MSTQNPNSKKGQRPALAPILRKDIEEAQANTKSGNQAAKWLGVDYRRYKQYAKLYGIYERHKNQRGIGIDKGFSHRPHSTPLKDILAGKHPTYSISKLKNRLVARGKLTEECNLCGFNERRFTDKKIPLLLNFKDGDRTHMALDNLELLCYNCTFLTTDAKAVQYRQSIEKSLKGEEMKNHRAYAREPNTADGYEYDMHDDVPQVVLSDEERAQLLQELHDDIDD